jgi:3-hydroxybutyryl-CoA dehydrogenase
LRIANIVEIKIIVTVVFTAPAKGGEGFAEKCALLGQNAIEVADASIFPTYPDADLYIDACFNGDFADVKGFLLFHCPAFTLNDLPNAPLNSARFCAWPGFWDRDLWEIALKRQEDANEFQEKLAALGIKAKVVPDIAGLIAVRILCTIINEAAFTLADNIANEADIDIAMKLGTNYPYGPVEWLRSIGANEVKQVLIQMSREHVRYLPAAHLEKLV